jgi:hypothetical protein
MAENQYNEILLRSQGVNGVFDPFPLHFRSTVETTPDDFRMISVESYVRFLM